MASQSHAAEVKKEPEAFTARSAVDAGMSAALITGGAGTFTSAIQNSLTTHKAGAMGVFTRTGKTIALFTALGGTYAFSEAAIANARESDDALNAAAGGCAAGMVAGASVGSLPMMAGSCLAIGTLMGTFRAAGAYLNIGSAASGHGEESGLSAEKERSRKSFFKQPQETESSD